MESAEPMRPTFTPTDSPMDILVKLSRYYGGDPDFVVAGGGNTSMKTEDVLHVKASGVALASIEASGFVALGRKNLSDLLKEEPAKDAAAREERVKQGMLAARVKKDTALRPSVEAILHHILPGRFVVHTHSTHAGALACCQEGERLAREWFGDEVLWVSYVDPGFLLARAVAQALSDYRSRTGRGCPEAVLLQNHGLIVAGDEPQTILRRTDRVVGRIRAQIDLTSRENVFGAVTRLESDRVRQSIEVIAPALRALLADGPQLKVVTFDDSDATLSLAGGSEGRSMALIGPMAPDQIVYAGAFPLWFEPPEQETEDAVISALREEIAKHARTLGFPPKVVVVRGLGLFAAGDDFQSADIARQMYRSVIDVMALAGRLGGVHPMTETSRRFIEGWEAEAHRRATLSGSRSVGRAAGKVTVVTGAAQGFGLEISQGLAAQGAHVALTDINAEGVERTARQICDRFGGRRAMGLIMDVTSMSSIAEGIHRIVRMYGGFDVFISNAGVLTAGSVKTQSEKEFDFVTDVNYKGYFRCVQHAAPVLAVQHKALPTYTSDIIQINSKSGLAGSNRNGAYAGGKFGGIGLTQSFALELIEDGIKVNAVCPGNFFDGPLWSDPEHGLFVQYLRSGKIPGAKTVEDVRRAYEARVPMRRGCTTADVLKAIYYLMEQQYETGQAVPVTGGQIMLH
jgi:rhamnose utilization protein RhaD (predicted bifunctional aldolase and dehydrogenase)/NAD(P)-dependent dehydrogenase (short-subunit alcohol dehydrogenase family)